MVNKQDKAEIINFCMNNYYMIQYEAALQEVFGLCDIVAERNMQIADLEARLQLQIEVNDILRAQNNSIREEPAQQIARRLEYESETDAYDSDDREFERLVFGEY